MNSPFDLKDKVAVVTGGAGGIGTEIAMEYGRPLFSPVVTVTLLRTLLKKSLS